LSAIVDYSKVSKIICVYITNVNDKTLNKRTFCNK
jgi:hypothetical protein